MWPGGLAMLVAGASPLLAAQAVPAASPQAAPAAPAAQAPPKDVVIERITIDELKKLMAADKVMVLDVRGAEAYREAHIPGSVSIPQGEIDKHVAELKSSKKPIVTYCS
jgi:3-mercaptopyruvate sulfurtransferase SseA